MKIQIHSFIYSVFHATNIPWTLILLGTVRATENEITNKTKDSLCRESKGSHSSVEDRIEGKWLNLGWRTLWLRGAQGHGTLNSRGKKVKSFWGIVQRVFHEEVVEKQGLERGRGGSQLTEGEEGLSGAWNCHVQGLRAVRTTEVKRTALLCLHQRVWWENYERCFWWRQQLVEVFLIKVFGER